ncbi:carboxylesterase/lipase family protein [Propionibacterium australiense]|nr:carboxylesterase family protein [Propionibacterium australiense]SYZ34631.1 Carboxylesterase family [Propionibacterium australiense]VEH92757.1 Carboxylesterase [Propionibacterium australiense]
MQITPYGSVLADVTGGRVVGFVDNDGMKVFRGIPYAAAPYGANRFKAPQPVVPWDGERDATTFGPSTYQIEPLFRGHGFNYRAIMSPGWRPGDETLNLNIWTPGEAGDNLPVLVYIHGGAFLTGNGGLPAYDGHHLAERGAVYVSIHYRTGTEGFGAFEGAATNRGLRDQIAALTWVQENIARFGGDPDRVMVHGESAGGMSIALLLASPAADGLFHRAIVQSGSSPMADSPELAADRARRIAAALGTEPTAEAIAAVDQKTLLDTALPALAENHTDRWDMLALGPWVDGEIVPEDLDTAMLARPVRPTIWGTNRDEGNLFLITPDMMSTATEETLAGYLMASHGAVEPLRTMLLERARIHEPGMAMAQHLSWTTFTGPTMTAVDQLAGDGRPTWLYRFDYASRANDGRAQACHMSEFPFVWDNLDSPAHRQMTGPNPPQRLATEMADAWVRFAATADPGWPAFTDPQRIGRVFDTTSRDVPGLDQELWRAWTNQG